MSSSRLTDLQTVCTPYHVARAIGEQLMGVSSAQGLDMVFSPTMELAADYVPNIAPAASANGAVIVWNRTPILTDVLSWRRVNGTLTAITEDGKNVAICAAGKFTMTWRFSASNTEILEDFELLYAARQKVSDESKIKVATTNLGDFDYTLDWQPITDIGFEMPTQFSCYVESTVDVTGIFLASRTRAATDNIITSINTDDKTIQVLDQVVTVKLFPPEGGETIDQLGLRNT